MKVIYARTQFFFNLKSGGSVGHTFGVLNGLRQNNCALKILSNDHFAGIGDHEHWVSEPWRGKWFLRRNSGELLYNLYAQNKYKKKIAEFSPDFIYHRYTGYTYFVARLADRLNIPLVLEFNSFETWTMRYWSAEKRGFWKRFKGAVAYYIVNKIEQYNLRKATVIITVSRVLQEDLIKAGVPMEKILVMPNGVDASIFSPVAVPESDKTDLRRELRIPPDASVVGFSGTFGPWHGVPQLCDAIKMMAFNQEQPVHFLFVGDGLLRKDAEKQMADHRENVIFVGEVPYAGIQRYLAICDVLVSPHCPQADGKEFFGSPTKLFEYMAMGKGIVASRLGQICEILENEQTALLVEPGNSLELAEAIKRLAHNAELRKQLGYNARNSVIDKYSWNKNMHQLLKRLVNTN